MKPDLQEIKVNGARGVGCARGLNAIDDAPHARDTGGDHFCPGPIVIRRRTSTQVDDAIEYTHPQVERRGAWIGG